MPEPSEEAADPRPDDREVAEDAIGSRRYSFSAFARDAWSQFRSATPRLIAIFCIVHVIAALLPYLVVFDVPDAVGYPLVFLFRVVIPVVLGTFAVATSSVWLLGGRRVDADEEQPAEREVARPLDRIRAQWSDVVVMGLVASLLGTGAVLLLGAYGFLILHLFYGPPVAMQALLLERVPYRDALQRAKLLLRGNWRTILYLLNVSLGIGALSLVILDLVVRAVGGGPDALVRTVLGIAQGLVLGALVAFIAGAQAALYVYLRDQAAARPERTTEEAAVT